MSSKFSSFYTAKRPLSEPKTSLSLKTVSLKLLGEVELFSKGVS